MYTNNDLKKGKVNPQSIYFDGHCLDKEVPGYETISVAGRELFSPELKTLIVGNQDGDRLQQNRFPARDIKVTYQIQRRTAGELRESYHVLNAKLLGIKKKIWFEDEPELYYVGTLSDAEVPTAGMTKFQSTFTLHCNDPFAYAMREDSFAVASAGTYDFKLDFANKIFGDFSSNPNMIYGAEWHEIENRKPDSLWWEWEQENYNKLAKQDGVCGSYTRTDVGNSTRLVMRFDVINAIEQQMPGFWQRLGLIELSERLTWLSDHIKKFYVEVWSYGHGASGYGTKVQTWSGSEWIGAQSNTASKPAKNAYSFAGQEAAAAMTDGYFYVLTGTNDADATTPTASYLDYAALSVSVDVPAASDSVTVTNDGTLPVPVRFELTNHEDNGFIGLAGNKQTIMVGKPNEIDGGFTQRSERIFTTKQDNSIGLTQWIVNGGVLNDWNEDARQVGKFHAPYETRWRLRNNGGLEFWGQPLTNKRGWHGPSVYAEVIPDSNGAKGAINFQARAYVSIGKANMRDTGLTQVNISGPDKEFIAGVQIWAPTNGHAGIKVRIGNHWAYVDEYNPRWDKFFGSIKISRHGNTYTIEVQDVEGGLGTKQTITYTDPDSAQIKAVGITYWKAMWGDLINDIAWQDPYDFWLQKDNVEDYVDVPNTFVDGDKVVIDGQDGKVTTKVNGTLSIALQNIGSQPILAYPGKNVINVLYSDFASAPDVTAYIRKKYL